MRTVANILSVFVCAGCTCTTTRVASPVGTDPQVIEAVQNRMREIVIPRLDLDNVTLPEGIAALKRAMIENDPRGTGISMFVQLDGPPLPSSPAAPTDDHDLDEPRITLHLTEVSLENALEALCVESGLKWTLTPRLAIAPEPLLQDPDKIEHQSPADR